MLLAGTAGERAKQELNSTVRWKSKQTLKSERLFFFSFFFGCFSCVYRKKKLTRNLHEKIIYVDENKQSAPTDQQRHNVVFLHFSQPLIISSEIAMESITMIIFPNFVY